jgi:hypothetical protein
MHTMLISISWSTRCLTKLQRYVTESPSVVATCASTLPRKHCQEKVSRLRMQPCSLLHHDQVCTPKFSLQQPLTSQAQHVELASSTLLPSRCSTLACTGARVCESGNPPVRPAQTRMICGLLSTASLSLLLNSKQPTVVTSSSVHTSLQTADPRSHTRFPASEQAARPIRATAEASGHSAHHQAEDECAPNHFECASTAKVLPHMPSVQSYTQERQPTQTAPPALQTKTHAQHTISCATRVAKSATCFYSH